MKYINIIIISLLVIKISCLSRALFYAKSKCFYDHYYSQMNLVINYKILDEDIKMPKNIRNLFEITIVGVENGQFKSFYGSKLSGKFSYNIEESDKYRICFYCSNKEIFKQKNFLHLQFNIQSNDDLYDENSAKAKDFQKVNNTMRKITKQVDAIETMQKYQLEIEDQFSNKQIKSSSRLAFLSICQILIICIVGIYHVFSLRKTFKDKIWSPF